MTLPEFVDIIEDNSLLLIKPNEIRKRFTAYVYKNKARALLPTKLLRVKQVYKGETDDGGDQEGSRIRNMSSYLEEDSACHIPLKNSSKKSARKNNIPKSNSSKKIKSA